MREAGLHGHNMVPCHPEPGQITGKGSVAEPPSALPLQALAETSLPAESAENKLFFDDLCLKLLCGLFLAWNDHYLRNSLHSRCE